jgi:hypothetical protein
MDRSEILQQAIQSIKTDDKATGKRLLAQILRAEPDNVRAWLWMSGVVDTDAQRRDCLLRVLALDPENATARAGLARLSAPGTDARSLAKDEVQPSTMFTVAEVEAEPPLAAQRGATRAPEQDRFPPLDETQRRRGYRNIMLAGAMMFTMMCGLVLLFITVTTVVPQAQERIKPTPEPVLYTATLWCLPCEQAGSPVILWEKVGDGVSRGGKTGELPHSTEVSVLAAEWSAPEKRTYFKITAEGQKGWVPETFIAE